MKQYCKSLFIGLWVSLHLTFLSSAQPATASLEGSVLDVRTNQPIAGASISIWINTGKPLVTQRAKQDGSFQFQLSAQQTYRIVTEAPGYLPAEERLAFTDNRASRLYGKQIRLTRAELTTVATSTTPEVSKVAPPVLPFDPEHLPTVTFVQGTTELQPEAQAALTRLVAYLRDHPTARVEIAGHTDNQGNFDQNVVLSQQRADLVKTYLVEQGISANRLHTRGYGGTRPIASNNHEATRQLNRRVELLINK